MSDITNEPASTEDDGIVEVDPVLASIESTIARRFGSEVDVAGTEPDATDDDADAGDDVDEAAEGGDADGSRAVGPDGSPLPPNDGSPDGDPGDGDGSVQGEPAASDETPPAFEPVKLGPLTFSSPEEAEGAAEALAWLRTQSPETLQSFVDIASGTHVLVPVEQWQAIQAGNADGAPRQDGVPDPLERFGDVEPEVAEFLRQQEAQIQQLRADEQSRQTEAYQNELARVTQIAAEVRQEVATRYGLSEEEVSQVEQHLASLQVVGTLVDRHNGDHRAAFMEGMEAAAAMIPATRAKLIAGTSQVVTSTESDDDARVLAENRARKAKAAAATSSSGSVASQAPDLSSLSPSDRAAARREMMAQDIGTIMGRP